MREALRLARKAQGRTSPNPAVGAVVARRDKIIASGYHRKAGSLHAEATALGELNGKAHDEDVLYVTLEPCNHHGKTPPCTEAILKQGIKKVVVGLMDPNPDVQGGGCRYLAEKGVDIKTGVLESECRELVEDFIKYSTTNTPFVIAKTALTLDGWTATSTGHSKWVTNEKSRRFVHGLRDKVQGIMVGVNTVLADNPSLTTRLNNRKGRDPIRIILDTNLRTPLSSKVINQESSAPTLIAVGKGVSEERVDLFQCRNVKIVHCPLKDGRIDLSGLMTILGKMQITSLLVEGGATLMGSLFRGKLIDKFFIFKAPKILGGHDGIPLASGKGPDKMSDSLVLKDIKTRRFGDDVLITGYPDY